VKVIKLGGSIITNKAKFGEFREENAKALSKVISDSGHEAIIIHGAGSFGHIKAMDYHLNVPGQIEGKTGKIAEVIGDVLTLNSLIVGTMIREGINAFSLPPHSIFPITDKDYELIDHLLRNRFVPVLYGDIIVSDGDYRIISGDEIALEIAKKFSPEEVIFVTDVDGLFTSDPKKDKNARLIGKVRAPEIDIGYGDVDATGSMRGKVERIKEILKYTNKVLIVNGNYPDRLGKALRNEDTTGTVIT
jgi:isopentenyl phosphate kinase